MLLSASASGEAKGKASGEEISFTIASVLEQEVNISWRFTADICHILSQVEEWLLQLFENCKPVIRLLYDSPTTASRILEHKTGRNPRTGLPFLSSVQR